MLAEDLDELRLRWLRNPDLVEYKGLNDARSKVGFIFTIPARKVSGLVFS